MLFLKLRLNPRIKFRDGMMPKGTTIIYNINKLYLTIKYVDIEFGNISLIPIWTQENSAVNDRIYEQEKIITYDDEFE